MQDKSIEELKEKFKQNDENNKIIKNHQHPQVTNEKFKKYQDFLINQLKIISENIKNYLKYLKPGTTGNSQDKTKRKDLMEYKNNICSAIKFLCHKGDAEPKFKIFMGDSDLAAICAYSDEDKENITHPIAKKKMTTVRGDVLLFYFIIFL